MTLCIEHLSYHVDGCAIIDDLCARAESGDLIGLIGPNGAGKSTLANVITGFLPVSSGTVRLRGRLLTGLTPEQIALAGVVRTFQTPHLPWNLTAMDCLLAVLSSNPTKRWSLHFAGRGDLRAIAADMLTRMGLSSAALTPARDLSFGEQRLLGFAMALARPSSLLILDEPFTGLKSAALETIVKAIREEVRTRAVIIIDHALSAVRAVASCLWFMHKGHLTIFEDFKAMVASEGFTKNYLGARSASTLTGSDAATDSSGTVIKSTVVTKPPSLRQPEPVLTLSQVTAGYGNNAIIQGIDLKVYPGEIVCIIGLNGSGKSTLLRAVVGLAHLFEGEIALQGRRFIQVTPDRVIREGVRLLVQDHRLFRSLTLRDNIMVSAAACGPAENSSMWCRLMRSVWAQEAADAAIHKLRLSGIGSNDRPAGTYSGGEQARIALAQLQLGRPKLLLLDEPTSGIDGVAAESLRAAIRAWNAQNIPVVVVEHALDFVACIATRVLVLSHGRIHEVKLSPLAGSEDLAEQLLQHLES